MRAHTGWVLVEDFSVITACIAVMSLVDHAIIKRFVFPSDESGRWFLLHAVVNAVVVTMCAGDAWVAVTDPIHSAVGDYNLWTVYIIAAVHIYHMVGYSNLTVQDWVHHLVFASVICLAGLVFTVGPGLGLIAFFVCGLPGGLDYFMLALVKLGKMRLNTEKRWNARIMVWLRAPGCIVTANCFYVTCLYGPRALTNVEFAAAIGVALLCFVNGQYYMQRVVGNAYQKDSQMKLTGC
eukprot:PhM_4_TR2709/c0_g1_i1/m.34140